MPIQLTISLADSLIFAVIILIISLISFIKDYRKSSIEYKNNNNFKATAIKIVIKLNEVKVTSKGWVETTKEIKANRWNRHQIIYNSMSGNDHKNFITTKNCINTLSYKFKHNEKNYNQTLIVDMDIYNLKIWFELQKETYLYIGTGKFENRFYLDLEFMDR